MTPNFAGRYTVTGPIGRGATGEVDRAYDTVLRRPVAIKRLIGAASVARRARLLREARAVAQLSHPNVVNVFDVGEVDGASFVVMELVLGGSLRERLQRGPPPAIEEALDWLEQMADALACAHRAGLVHRDVKPANLLLTAEGKLKIADFGIVKELETGGGPAALTVTATTSAALPLTRAGTALGTPRYMAPEQLRAETVDGSCLLYTSPSPRD